jgi:hypothetical protein
MNWSGTEVITADFKVQSQHFLRETEENQIMKPSRKHACGLKIEPRRPKSKSGS